MKIKNSLIFFTDMRLFLTLSEEFSAVYFFSATTLSISSKSFFIV
jgi:hypothetical protein